MQHFGLFFTPEHIQHALRSREEEPLRSAWMLLREREPARGAASAQWYGLLYRFEQDAAAAARAVEAIIECSECAQLEARGYFDALTKLMTYLHAFEMVRDYPGFQPDRQRHWANFVREQLAVLETSDQKDTLVETVWFEALSFVAGIVFEDAARIERGAAMYRQFISEEVRPQGFLPRAVEGGDGGGFFRQVVSVSALVLMAEAGQHIGLDLWSFNVRGVSVVTGALYPIYYFYTTDKWRWDENLPVERAQAQLRKHGGYLEMVYRRNRHRDLKTLLDDLRPVYDPPGGGLTTLTHGVAERRRGLFG